MILVRFKGWGLDEDMRFVHLQHGNTREVANLGFCTYCYELMPDEQYLHLLTIRNFLDSTKRL